MQILAIANHKGGTGKTATARALGDQLASAGYKVLLVDLDPQASLTTSCGYAEPVSPSMVDVIGSGKPGRLRLDQIMKPVKDGLDLAPSNLDMAVTELQIISRPGRDHILKKALGKVHGYDLVILDCGPNIGTLTINALVACHAVLIPTQPSPVDMVGVKRFIETVEMIRDEELNPTLEILGILPTFYDHRYNTHRAAVDAMKGAGWPVLDVTVGRSVRVAEAAAVGESVITYEPDNPQAGNYQELGKILEEQWLKNKTKPNQQ
jgi:chromosome partitioning protein